MNDNLRAAIVAFLQSMFPLFVLFDLAQFTDVQVAAVMLAVNNGLTLVMLFWKTGQGVDQAGTRRAAEGAAVAAVVAAETVAPVTGAGGALTLDERLDMVELELARQRDATGMRGE